MLTKVKEQCSIFKNVVHLTVSGAVSAALRAGSGGRGGSVPSIPSISSIAGPAALSGGISVSTRHWGAISIVISRKERTMVNIVAKEWK